MLSFVLMGFSIILIVFWSALFAMDKSKRYSAYFYTAIGYLTLVLLFIHVKMYFIVIGMPIMAILIVLMLTNGNKSIGYIAWAVNIAYIAVYFVSMNKFNFSNIDFDLFDLDWRLNKYDIYVPYKEYFVVVGIPFVYCAELILMFVASIVRHKRRTWYYFNKHDKKNDAVAGDVIFTSRISKNGCAVVGNILSIISYFLIILSIKCLLMTFMFSPITIHDNSSWVNVVKVVENDYVVQAIVFALIGVVCGIIGWLLLRHAMSYGYELGGVWRVVYIWSWIPAVIAIAFIVATMLIICLVTDMPFSETANKKIYKVIDENGEVRTLEKLTADAYEKCKDNRGDWWETYDGGKTFAKCGLRSIKNEDGTTTQLRDVGGGTGALYEDDLGILYESEDGGKTVKKYE